MSFKPNQNFFDEFLNIKQEPEEIIIDVAEEDDEALEEETFNDSSLNCSDSDIKVTTQILKPWEHTEAQTKRKKYTVNKLLPCDLCGKKYSTQSSLNTHKKENHGKPGFCEICKKHQTLLKYHLKFFHSEDLHECDQCDFNTKYVANLQMHKKSIHLKDVSYHCEFCNKSFNHPSNKNRHVRSAHNTEEAVKSRFHCQICGPSLTFTRHDNLKLHLRRIHGKSEKAAPEKFYCDFCGVSYVSKNSILRHIRLFHKPRPRPFKCDICLQRFAQRITLTNHLDSRHFHKFQCKICNKILGSEQTLKIHEARKKCQSC